MESQPLRPTVSQVRQSPRALQQGHGPYALSKLEVSGAEESREEVAWSPHENAAKCPSTARKASGFLFG